MTRQTDSLFAWAHKKIDECEQEYNECRDNPKAYLQGIWTNLRKKLDKQ